MPSLSREQPEGAVLLQPVNARTFASHDGGGGGGQRTWTPVSFAADVLSRLPGVGAVVGAQSVPTTPLPLLSPSLSERGSPRRFEATGAPAVRRALFRQMPDSHCVRQKVAMFENPFTRQLSQSTSEEGSVTPTLESLRAERSAAVAAPPARMSLAEQTSHTASLTTQWSASNAWPKDAGRTQSDDLMDTRPESAISEHPSLATCSIDMDQELLSRATDEADLMDDVGYATGYAALLSDASSAADAQSGEARSKSATTWAEQSLTDGRASEQATTSDDLSAFADDAQSAADAAPSYPRAFVSARTAPCPPALHAGAGSNRTQEVDNAMLGGANSSTLLLGPSFKASISQTNSGAVWSPSAAPTNDNATTHSEFERFGMSSPIAGYNAIQFVPAATSTPTWAKSESRGSDVDPLLSFAQEQTQRTPLSPPPPAKSGVIPAPPPAPPKGIAPPTSQPVSFSAGIANNTCDIDRSVIEYPEKQSVANLRSAIQSKLSGSAPVKVASESTALRSAATVVATERSAGHYDTVATPTFANSTRCAADGIPAPPPPPPSAFAAPSVPVSKGFVQSQPTAHSPSSGFASLESVKMHPAAEQWGNSAQPVTREPLPTSCAFRSAEGAAAADERGSVFSPAFSPAPPPRPPSPSGAVSSSLSGYGGASDYRGGSVPVRGRASPPPDARLFERKSSIEGNRVRLDSYYALPHDDPTSYRQFDGTTSAGARRNLSSGSGYQHHWYKMMYKKLHQIDPEEEQSVLKYRIRDQRSPSPYHQQQYISQRYEQHQPRPQSALKYGSHFSGDGADYTRGYTPQPYNVATLPRSSAIDSDVAVSRQLRSKSAGRYTSSSPLPVDVVRSSGTHTPYRAQPGRIEHFAPSDVERWRDASGPVRPAYRRHLSETTNFGQFDAEMPPRPATAAVTPPTPHEARQWYRNIQAGGEVPYGGLRQAAPERGDSFLRTAVQLISQQANAASASVRDSATSPAQVDGAATCDRRLDRPVLRRNYTDYWRHHYTAEAERERRRVQQRGRQSPASPVACRQTSSGRFALERSKVHDFHLPFFRTSPKKAPPRCDVRLFRDVDWPDVEAYFALLKRVDVATSTDINRRILMKYNKLNGKQSEAATGRDSDIEFAHVCHQIESAMSEIDLIGTPDSFCANGYAVDSVMQRSSSFPEGIGGGLETVVLKKSVTFDGQRGSRTGATDEPWRFDGDASSAAVAALHRGAPPVEAADQMTRSQSASELTQALCRAPPSVCQRASAMRVSNSYTDLSLRDDNRPPPPPVRSLLKCSTSELSLSDAGSSKDNLWRFQYRPLTGDPSSGSSAATSLQPTPRRRARAQPTRSCSAPAIASLVRTGEMHRLTRPFAPPSVPSKAAALSRKVHGYHSYLYRRDPTTNMGAVQALTRTSATSTMTSATRLTSESLYPSEIKCLRRNRVATAYQERGGETFRSPMYADVQRTNWALDSAIDELRLARLGKEAIFEEERRKRQEREADDLRSRRHGYTPVPSKSPGITDERFGNFLNDFGRSSTLVARPATPVGADLRGVAKALYAFRAHNPRELNFNKGDLIRIRRMIDPYWFEGELRGRVGILPTNYVEMAAVAKEDSGLSFTEIHESHEGQAKVIYSFDGRTINELSIKKGDFVTLTKRVDGNWYEGRSSMGRVGIFPSNYIRVLREPSQQHKKFSSDLNLAAEATNAAAAAAALPRETDFRAFDQFDRSPSTPSANRDASSRLRAAGTGGGARFRVLYGYRPQKADEVELNEGDVVRVVEQCDDGWFIGTCESTGAFGTFPGNYVRQL